MVTDSQSRLHVGGPELEGVVTGGRHGRRLMRILGFRQKNKVLRSNSWKTLRVGIIMHAMPTKILTVPFAVNSLSEGIIILRP